MKWTEVKIETASEAVESIANMMMEFGANGVAIEDAFDLEYFQSDQYGEILDKQSFSHIKEGAFVIAYFPETVFLPEILPIIREKVRQLTTFGLNVGKNLLTVETVAESDWATAWKKYYHPVRVTRYLTIVPSWEIYQKIDESEKIIILDPGMAFGTGTHPTTRLTLQALETVIRGGETMLDVGTGSGVLSIAGKALGVGTVHAYDLDEVAVSSAKENMALNPIAKDVQVQTNNLLKSVKVKADLIVTNILADIILLMIEDAWRLLTSDGIFIVSGIIHDKKEMILEKLKQAGFVLEMIYNQGDWYTMILKKSEGE